MTDGTGGPFNADIYRDIDWSWRWGGHTALGRFMSKIDHSRADGCWVWTGGISSTGYGSFGVQGRRYLAHRAMFALWYGSTAEELDHICRVRRCVNPEHLEPVSHWENNARGESPSAYLLRATHCKYGHPWTPENIGAGVNGTRRCLTCHRQAEAARNRAKREMRLKVLNVQETATRLGVHVNTVRAWTLSGRLTNVAPLPLKVSRYDPEQVESLRVQTARERLLRHRPSVIKCPVCGKETETQPDYDDARTAYICDTETCPVSSLEIRWSTMAEEHANALAAGSAR
jgi:transposase